MPTPREVGGYIWNEEVARAIRANKVARKKLARMLMDDLSGERFVRLLAEINHQLSEELDALVELEKIGEVQAKMRKQGRKRK